MATVGCEEHRSPARSALLRECHPEEETDQRVAQATGQRGTNERQAAKIQHGSDDRKREQRSVDEPQETQPPHPVGW
jgi:hypothetical protein